ncbi:uncharacterized protein MONBRDRAFT_32945, partial [Monosiga brevicollis MX1]
MAAFQQQMEALKEAKSQQCGDLTLLEDEKQLFDITTSQKRVICHFSHPDFRRCAIMTSHLREMAKHHFTTRFVEVNAEQTPFLAQRLKITVLPTVLCFLDGVVKDRLMGFEELGNSDNFATKHLEARLARSGVISLAQAVIPAGRGKSILGAVARPQD